MGSNDHQNSRNKASKDFSAQKMEALLQYNQTALIFQHPPQTQNFPSLYKDKTFY